MFHPPPLHLTHVIIFFSTGFIIDPKRYDLNQNVLHNDKD